jgi:hypothetical protein
MKRQSRGTQPMKRSRRGDMRQDERIRGFAAINRVRRGESDSLTAAARAEGTSVEFIKRELPEALLPSRPGERLRVRATDPYSAVVGILTDSGVTEVWAHGSYERELAGRHRAVWMKVLRGDLPPSALEEFRGKKVGGHELLSDPDRLFELLKAGELNQLDAVYVSPETQG